MKFGYSYKTTDGSRHEDFFEARTKEAVFAALRAKGIKPIKVWEIHGRFYVSLRTRVIIFLAAALIGLIIFTLRTSSFFHSPSALPQTLPRHQIYGDPVLIEDLEREGYQSVFPNKGDQILAAFAIPGRAIANLGLSRGDIVQAIEACKDADLDISEDDSVEAQELKRILNGMKEELRWYVADGVGTVESYWKRLVERQEEEVRIYERACQEVELSNDPKLRLKRNQALRAMGLKTIPRKDTNTTK